MILTENRFKQLTRPVDAVNLVFENFAKKEKGERFVFIAHCPGESEYVYRLKSVLDKAGFTGYAEWEDVTVWPEQTDTIMSKFKEAINQSYKFILVATEGAIRSPWWNWLAGYGLACKKQEQVVLLPISKGAEYPAKQYLQLYPTIQVQPGKEKVNEYYVAFPQGNILPLKEWLEL
jgi:hypothetical protein